LKSLNNALGKFLKTLGNGVMAMAKKVEIDNLSVRSILFLGTHFPSLLVGENL